jgi:ABC-type Fe3+/spermidine/putrescine transport system ATPase subunit
MARAKRQQQEIPGTEAPKHPEIEEAAETYVAYRDERMDLAVKERESKKALVETMARHGVTMYKFKDGDGAARTVVAETKVNAKVSKDRKTKEDEGFVQGGDSGGEDLAS